MRVFLERGIFPMVRPRFFAQKIRSFASNSLLSRGLETWDVCVVGGGVMGSATAYFLKSQAPDLSVVVIEQDPTYKRASTGLSVGSIRQQFSIDGNIEMSLFSSGFIRNVGEYLSIEGDEDEADVQFVNSGYLFLATESGVPILRENHSLQTSLGAKVELLSPGELGSRFPWMTVDDVAEGALGTENEGWFDPWSLLNCFKKKASSIGVEYAHGECVDIGVVDGRVTHVDVVEETNRASGNVTRLKVGTAVNASGPWASKVHRMVDDPLNDLPVRPRRRNVFVVHAPDGPVDSCPMLIDPSGVYVRREGTGGHFLCGKSPEPEDDPDADDLEVDHDFFEEHIWERLAHRVPAFENLKVVNSWSGFYEYNTMDQNAIIGRHPSISNYLMICGFSGHGIQQSPAAGRGVSELILQGRYTTIDLAPFGYERILSKTPLLEKNVI